MEKTEGISSDIKYPHFFHAIICFLGVLLFVFYGVFYLKTCVHSIMLFCIVWVSVNAYFAGNKYDSIKVGMHSSIKRAVPVFSIFILIGVIIAAFIMSGTIPSLIYYGLNFLYPRYFLVSGLLLCSLMSVAIGTAWGTAGTMGLALIGIGSAFGFPLPIIAGMVVSGSFFGDKLSAASDTTQLSAMATGTNLYQHIRSMAYTLLPAYALTFILFFLLGLHFKPWEFIQNQQIEFIKHSLASNYHVHPTTLLPILVMIIFSLKKVSAEISIMCAILIAFVIGMTFQKLDLEVFLSGLFQGATATHAESTSNLIDRVLKSGGILSMMSSFSLTILVLALGGILETFGFLHVLLFGLLKCIKRPGTLVMVTIFTCIIGNVLMGEAYLSILLVGRAFRGAYAKLNLESCVLSRSIEGGATFSSPLIPWTTAGAFLSSALGVSTLDYMGWSFLNWIEPLIAIAFTYCGVALFRKKTIHRSDYVAV